MLRERISFLIILALFLVSCGRNLSDPQEAVKGHWISRTMVEGRYLHLFVDGERLMIVGNYGKEDESYHELKYSVTAQKSADYGTDLHITAYYVQQESGDSSPTYLLLEVRYDGSQLMLSSWDEQYDEPVSYSRGPLDNWDYVDDAQYEVSAQ